MLPPEDHRCYGLPTFEIRHAVLPHGLEIQPTDILDL